MAFPSSQKPFARPVGFILHDTNQTSGDDALSPFVFAPLVIRPDDLTRSDPSRMTVIQTLGGAWLDSFGPGVYDIRITGTTGWRGSMLRDGIAEMTFLRDTVFTGWHSRRADAVKQKKDPNNVKLVFIDRLDEFVCSVVPTSIRLHRQKSSPLIARYDINMTVLQDGIEGYEFPVFQFGISDLDDFIATVTDAINTIKNAISTAQQWLDTYIFAPISVFMGLTTQLFAAVMTIPSAIEGVYSSIVGTVTAASAAGSNMLRAFTNLGNIPARAKADLMGAALAYQTISVCSVRAFRSLATLPDFSDVYGASLCSSTSGGRAIRTATENVFETSQIRPKLPQQTAFMTPAISRLATYDHAKPLQPAQMRSDINGAVDYVQAALA